MGLAWGGGIRLLGMVQGSEVVGGGLVDVVVEPVGIDELTGGAPADDGGLVGVVVGEVVAGGLDVQAALHVPPVFPGQGVPVIFQVAQEEELAAVLRLYGEDAHFLRHGQDFQAGDLADVFLQHFCVAGVGGVEAVVEATEEGGGGF